MLANFYIKSIKYLQNFLMGFSVFLLMALPIALAYYKDFLPSNMLAVFYDVSLISVFLVMIIRPICDLLPKLIWLRPLIVLRKGLGVLSASIIVGIILSKVMLGGFAYLSNYLNADFWSFEKNIFFAHLGDVTAVILLVTSNNFSLRVLGKNWKRIQKLAYVYFFSGALYVFLEIGQTQALIFMILVSILTLLAFVKRRLPLPLA